MKKIIKYLSYGVVGLTTFVIGIFIVTNKNVVKAGASIPHPKNNCMGGTHYETCVKGAKNESHAWIYSWGNNGPHWYSLYSWIRTDTKSEVSNPGPLPHCHKWQVTCSDDSGDGGSEYIDYQEIND